MRDDEKTGPWRCFHCDMLIINVHQAREHFGEAAGNGTFCAERARLTAERDAIAADRDELDKTARHLLDEARRQIRNLEVRLVAAQGRPEDQTPKEHKSRSPDGDGPSTNAEPYARSREREKVTRLAANRDGDMHIPAGSEPADSHSIRPEDQTDGK